MHHNQLMAQSLTLDQKMRMKISVAFKTKVAPLQSVSVPCLELIMGAILGKKLALYQLQVH